MPAISSPRETYPTALIAPAPGLWRDPRVLEPGWVSPRLLGQDDLLTRLRTSVLLGLTPGARVAVSIAGPKGSGTSSVARWLVDSASAHIARPGAKGVPLVLHVDATACRTPLALVSALFRGIDPTFVGRGASTEFFTLLFLRRIRTVGRPAIIWFDQVPSKPAEIGRVLSSISEPARLLPEGPEGLPEMLVVTSGGSDPIPGAVGALRTALPPLLGQDLRQAIMARATAAFAVAPSSEAIRALADLSVARGWGLSTVGELLAEAGRRAEARGGRRLEVADVALPAYPPRHSFDVEGFEASLLEVLRGARGGIPVGELRQSVATRCRERGAPAPGHARLWRHLVALERRGLVQREVRLGGPGGSSSLVHLA